MSKRIPKSVDCPHCPECKGPFGMTASNYAGAAPSMARSLICAACGHEWNGTPDERAQAFRADMANVAREISEAGKAKAAAKRAADAEKLARAREGHW